MCVARPGCQSPTLIPCAAFFFFFKACTGDTQAFMSRIHLTEGKEGSEMGEAEVHLSTVVSSQRSLGKRTQTVLQECAAIFRLFTADAVSPAGSHTNTVPLSSDLVSGAAEVKGNHMGQTYTSTHSTA